MFRKTIVYHISTLLLILLLSTSSYAMTDWQELTPGIEYIDLGTSILSPWSHIHTFKIDLEKHDLGLILASSFAKPYASAYQFARKSHAIIAINGGFFDKNSNPLGLRISNYHQFSPLKRISWWGIFYIKNQKAHLASLNSYKGNNNVNFAVQTGPRLLINGQIPQLKAGIAERSAIGIAPDGKIIILVTENSPMTTTALAKLMKSWPINCKNALNLDGGSSSQIYAHINKFKLNVHGLSNVSDAIIVKP